MKICQNCKTQCADEMKFCHNCGTPLNAEVDFDATVPANDRQQNNSAAPADAAQGVTSESTAAAINSYCVNTQQTNSYTGGVQTEKAASESDFSSTVQFREGYPVNTQTGIPAYPPVFTPPAEPQSGYSVNTQAGNPASAPVFSSPVQPVNTDPFAAAIGAQPYTPYGGTFSAEESAPPAPVTPGFNPLSYTPTGAEGGIPAVPQYTNAGIHPDVQPPGNKKTKDKNNKNGKLIRNLIIISVLAALLATGIALLSREFSDSSSGEETKSQHGGHNTESDASDSTGILFADDELSYVMIYNPGIYDEENPLDESRLSTGDFNALQIDTSGFRGEVSSEINATLNTITTGSIDMNVPFDEIALSGIKSDGLEKAYEKYDTESFYYYSDLDNSIRDSDVFECLYAGKHCYIWSNTDAVDTALIEQIGNDFDKTLYTKTVSIFGNPRFTDDVGKVNFLIYDFNSPTTCGLSSTLDIFSASEVSQDMIEEYGFNTDHALIHINSLLCESELFIRTLESTLVHELQHYICSTSALMSPDITHCSSWLNEAMSGYIEEVVLPGVKVDDGHYNAFNGSPLIKAGQSLYNFTTKPGDIGVYGSVYLFSEYLAYIGSGSGVFKNIHSYWRNSYSDTLCESEAIYNSVPASTKERIGELVEYPSYVYFTSDTEEWMSKLTLDFYLKYLRKDTKINNFTNITPDTLLYGDLAGADIEGGGRIIVAVKNNEFSVPENADSGLVYVGLDKSFKQITEIVCK